MQPAALWESLKEGRNMIFFITHQLGYILIVIWNNVAMQEEAAAPGDHASVAAGRQEH